MKVSVLSDLHLEHAPLTGLPGGDVLVLAGDIWLYRDMRLNRSDAESQLRRQRYVEFCRVEISKYTHALVIAGNHESYGDLHEEMEEILRRFLYMHAPNAILLNNEIARINDVPFLGTTLWSGYGVGNVESERRIRDHIKDFRFISTKLPSAGIANSDSVRDSAYRPFTPLDANRAHREAITWLEQQLPKLQRCVVISHHAPSFQSAVGGRHSENQLDAAYCCELDPLILSHPQIEVWIHGHTHHEERYLIGGTKVIANPRGYFPHEPRSFGFDPRAGDFHI
jgi:predicted phosphodiesterase